MIDLEHAYRVLDLPYGAPDEDVRRAWRELTKVWHPDRFGSEPALRRRAEEKQKEINEAYEAIVAAGSSRFRWNGGFAAEPEESDAPEGWAVRTGGRIVHAPDLETIVQWLAAGELTGSEEVFDPVYGKWVPLAERADVSSILRRRGASRKRNWGGTLVALAFLLIFRRPSFGMLVVAGVLFAIGVWMLYAWARSVDEARK